MTEMSKAQRTARLPTEAHVHAEVSASVGDGWPLSVAEAEERYAITGSSEDFERLADAVNNA